MTARVQINPNLRLDQYYTMADLDEDVQGDLQESFSELVQVYEPISGLVGRGWVTNIDKFERTLTLMVEWSSLTILPSKNKTDSESSTTGVNRFYYLSNDADQVIRDSINAAAGVGQSQ